MLLIRQEQINIIEQNALQKFEDHMFLHLKAFSSRQCEILGEPLVRDIIRLGMERAALYGFTHQGPVRFYLELMFMFGSSFDSDPQYPWAGDILNNSTILGQMERAEQLYEKAMDYVDKVAGPENEYERQALLRLKQLGDILKDISQSNEDLCESILMHLNRIQPQKYNYVGEVALRVLISEATLLAKKYQIDNRLGISILVGLMFAFGYGCISDPLFPWIAGTLNNQSIADSIKRMERLYSKMSTYFETALTLF